MSGSAPGRTGVLAAFDHVHRVVLEQFEVGAKTNEIPLFATLLDRVSDLSGVVVTADAMHAQRDHATYLHSHDAHHVLTVKANQPSLHARLTGLPWRRIPVADRTRGRGHGHGHGRAETRTLKATAGGRCRAFVEDRIEARDILNLTVAFDHDMVDGAPAARFVERLIGLVESGSGLPGSSKSVDLSSERGPKVR